MQGNQKAIFNPIVGTAYKILSVLDAKKAFTVGGSFQLRLEDFKQGDTQKFQIMLQNGKYAIITTQNTALCVSNQNVNNGPYLKFDAGQYASSFFDVQPVQTGQWAGRACYIKTFCGKSLQIIGNPATTGNDIGQSDFNGGNSQVFVITPFNTPLQVFQQVPNVFVANPNTSYKISCGFDPTRVLTITKDKKACYSANQGDPSQKFKIYQNNGTYAFVVQSSNSGLCIAQDGTNNGAEVVVSPSQSPSSWFALERCTQGVLANKGYIIKTHTKKHGVELTSETTPEGNKIVMKETNNSATQIWMISPWSQTPNNNNNQHGSQPNIQPAQNNNNTNPYMTGGNQNFQGSINFSTNFGFTPNTNFAPMFTQGFNQPQGFNQSQGFNSQSQGFGSQPQYGFGSQQGFTFQGFDSNTIHKWGK